jgi:TATA-binding protein-associated factor Taf7
VKQHPDKAKDPSQAEVADANQLLSAANAAASQAQDIVAKLEKLLDEVTPPEPPKSKEESEADKKKEEEKKELASIKQQLEELEANLKAAHKSKPA